MHVTFTRCPARDTAHALGYVCRVMAHERSTAPRFHVNYSHGRALDAPSAADVLRSLALDASCAGLSHAAFCAELGYDSDSLAGWLVWQSIERQTRSLVRILSAAGQTLDAFCAEWAEQ